MAAANKACVAVFCSYGGRQVLFSNSETILISPSGASLRFLVGPCTTRSLIMENQVEDDMGRGVVDLILEVFFGHRPQ